MPGELFDSELKGRRQEIGERVQSKGERGERERVKRSRGLKIRKWRRRLRHQQHKTPTRVGDDATKERCVELIDGRCYVYITVPSSRSRST